MATVTPTLDRAGEDILVFTWNLTSANPDGAPVGPTHGRFADRAWTVVGTWGGATCKWEGSNDGVNWFTLNDPFGVDLSLSANGLFAVAEMPLYQRPNLTTVGIGADLTTKLVARRVRSGVAN